MIVGCGWKYSPRNCVSAVFTKSFLTSLLFWDLRYFPSFLPSDKDVMTGTAGGNLTSVEVENLGFIYFSSYVSSKNDVMIKGA